MTQIVFTVDVDRDVAWPKSGSPVGVSKHLFEPGFEASKKGFFSILELVERLGIPTTFFFEAKTAEKIGARANHVESHEVACHGFDHEDFTGKKTFSPLSAPARRATLQKAKSALEQQFGTDVQGFRAPYLHFDEALLEMLSQNGFTYDSSVVEGQLEKTPIPELFLPKWTDSSSKPLSGYFWQMMEGNRLFQDYVEAVKRAVQVKAPYVVLATHSWHTHVSVERGVLSEKTVRQNLQNIENVLLGVQSISGTQFVMAQEAARKV